MINNASLILQVHQVVVFALTVLLTVGIVAIFGIAATITLRDPLLEIDAALWVVAIGLFGLGDLFTTAIGLTMGLTELHPVGYAVFAVGGILGLIALKAIVFALFFGLYHITPRPYRVGVPLGLSILGAVITVLNLLVLSQI